MLGPLARANGGLQRIQDKTQVILAPTPFNVCHRFTGSVAFLSDTGQQSGASIGHNKELESWSAEAKTEAAFMAAIVVVIVVVVVVVVVFVVVVVVVVRVVAVVVAGRLAVLDEEGANYFSGWP